MHLIILQETPGKGDQAYLYNFSNVLYIISLRRTRNMIFMSSSSGILRLMNVMSWR